MTPSSPPSRRSAVASALLLGLALSVAPPAFAQDGTAEQDSRLVHTRELVTHFMTPQHLDARQAADLAMKIYGRNFYVVEHGGFQSNGVSNLHVLGRSILIHDTEERAQAIGQALHALDIQAQDEVDAQPSLGALRILGWTPRHIDLQSAWNAISHRRAEVVARDDRGAGVTLQNLTLMDGLGRIVIQDTPDRVASILAVLEAVDVPDPQLLLTCLILAGTDDATRADPELPADLAQDLSRLVPFDHFERVAFGAVRTSGRAESIELQLNESFRLRLEPDAYDDAEGIMTARVRAMGDRAGFDARTTLAADEFTVIGAAGEQPLFTVVRLHRLGPDAVPSETSGAR